MNMIKKINTLILNFWKDEEGMGTIEIVIIVFVLISLGFLFKTHIEKFFTGLMSKLDANAIGKDFDYK